MDSYFTINQSESEILNSRGKNIFIYLDTYAISGETLYK
jgi:hypothetical protein